jgi:hypothetical protein
MMFELAPTLRKQRIVYRIQNLLLTVEAPRVQRNRIYRVPTEHEHLVRLFDIVRFHAVMNEGGPKSVARL